MKKITVVLLVLFIMVKRMVADFFFAEIKSVFDIWYSICRKGIDFFKILKRYFIGVDSETFDGRQTEGVFISLIIVAQKTAHSIFVFLGKLYHFIIPQNQFRSEAYT